MPRQICEICGRTVNPEDVVRHRIVPEEVVRQAGILDLRTATLCRLCGSQIQDWYNKKVYSMSYDDRAGRFVAKSPAEMIKEYETAYKAFVAYKKAAARP